MNALKLLTSYAIGILILPLILLFTKRGATKLRWFDGYFGNKIDTINGDTAYQTNQALTFPIKYLPRYWWCAIRNPSHNYAFQLGATGEIVATFKTKDSPHTLGSYRASVMLSDATVHTFHYGVYKYPFINRYFRYAIGTKLWGNDKVGDKIDRVYALSVLPFITKETAGL